jgi:hypothetical protein
MPIASQTAKARIAGAFYLVSILSAIAAEAFIKGRLLYAAGLIPVLCFTVTTLLLYSIFQSVNRPIALLAALSNLIGLALEAVEWHVFGLNTAIILHGIYCLLIGYLVLTCNFLPRPLAIPIMLAGLAWLTALTPQLVHGIHAYIQIVGFAGEAATMLGLALIKTKKHSSTAIPA